MQDRPYFAALYSLPCGVGVGYCEAPGSRVVRAQAYCRAQEK